VTQLFWAKDKVWLMLLVNVLSSIVSRYIEKCFGKECLNTILSDYGVKLFSKNRHRERVCLIPKSVSTIVSIDLININVVAVGIIIGWIEKNSVFIPSTHLFNMVREKGFSIGCSIVAKQHGVKAFLYGRDLLALSVERFLYPVEKDMYVAVLDSEDMSVIGIGKLVIDPSDLGKLLSEGKVLALVVKNVFDLGILLRDEEYV